MNKNTKLTLAELIKRKEQMMKAKETPKTADLYIESLDAVISVQQPDAVLCQDAIDLGDDADRYMVLQSVIEPNLKDGELQKEYGVTEPMDIVDVLFLPGEVKQISLKCMELAGFKDSVQIVKTVKN